MSLVFIYKDLTVTNIHSFVVMSVGPHVCPFLWHVLYHGDIADGQLELTNFYRAMH